MVVGLVELPPERFRLSPAPALRGPTAPRSPRSLLSPRPCKLHAARAGWRRALSCARYSYVTATPRTDPAPACRPELTCGPQCEAARGYVKVLALHSACASGAHARARRAHTVCLYVRLLSIEFGHLSAQNRHIFRSAGLKRALARLRLARFLTRQKGLNHVPLAHPDRGSSPHAE